jgi:6-methylsalicylate decarboxylase
VLVAPSCPIGVEALPGREALPLVDAYHRGVARLPRPFRPWATAALDAPDPRGLADLLTDGFAGLCLPAGAFSDPAGARRVSAFLDVLEDRDAPLFIHPGPSPWATAPAHPAGAAPWWPALTHYVYGMQTAWHVVQSHVRPVRPGLRILFAMLAGLAPLQADRMRVRGETVWAPHPLTFLETSSYGPETARAVAAVTGPRSVLHGSDRPVAVPPHMPGDGIRRSNPTRLLATTEVIL